MTEQRHRMKDIWLGIGLTALLHLLILIFPFAVFAIGIVQLIYMIPAILLAYYKKRTGIMQGLLIGAAVTFLVNAACFGIVFTQML